MAEGDMCGDIVAISDGSYATIKPSTSGIEWVIHNIYVPVGSVVEIYYTNGITDIKICTTSVSLCGYCFHCNALNTYLKITNISGENIVIGYDGTQTSE